MRINTENLISIILPAAVIFFLGSIPVIAQDIAAYNPHEHFVELFQRDESEIGDMQIWSIEEGNDGFIFAATNEGLMYYDGVRWNRGKTEKSFIQRALYFDRLSGRMYSAGVNGFGVWQKDSFGEICYRELFRNSDASNSSIDFWRIIPGNSGNIFFQSHSSVYKLNTETENWENISLPEGTIGYCFDNQGSTFIQVNDRFIEFDANGPGKEICKVNDRITSMLNDRERTMIALEHSGLFYLNEGRLTAVDKSLNRILSSAKVNCVIKFMDGLLIGTTRSGVIITDGNYRICDKQFSQLSSSTVLSSFIDAKRNIWLGFNIGIAKIDNSSNELFIRDQKLGQVEAISQTGNSTLIATNKGLFEYNGDKIRNIEGASGVCWGIVSAGSQTYILHDSGIFRYQYGRMNLVHGGGVTRMVQMEQDHDYWIACNYDRLSLFKQSAEGLKYISEIKGFKSYPMGLTIDKDDNLWLTTSGIGFKRIRLSADKMEVAESKDFLVSFDDDDKNTFISYLYGDMVFYAGGKAYTLNRENDVLEYAESRTELLSHCAAHLNTFSQKGNVIWYISDDDIGYVEINDRKIKKHSGLFLQNRNRRIKRAIFDYGDGIAIGFNNSVGYIEKGNEVISAIPIGRVEAIGTDESISYDMTLGAFKVPFSANSMRLFPVCIPDGLVLDYRIDDKEWLTIKLRDNILIPALSPGKHKIEIRPSGLTDEDNITSLNIDISRPWYISNQALVIYILAFLTLLSGLISYFRYSNRTEQERIKRRQVEILEREKIIRDKQIAELQKEQIKIELREKDKRLANLTMSNIKRNNILNDLKIDTIALKDCDNQAIKPRINQIVRKIDEQLSNDEDWKKSEDYFNTIYDGLLDRLKEQYPSLTKTDMKLCVYMKLNLSTKETANLMNISPRSVEMARYRLKKRLGLNADEPIEKILTENFNATT